MLLSLKQDVPPTPIKKIAVPFHFSILNGETVPNHSKILQCGSVS